MFLGSLWRPTSLSNRSWDFHLAIELAFASTTKRKNAQTLRYYKYDGLGASNWSKTAIWGPLLAPEGRPRAPKSLPKWIPESMHFWTLQNIDVGPPFGPQNGTQNEIQNGPKWDPPPLGLLGPSGKGDWGRLGPPGKRTKERRVG